MKTLTASDRKNLIRLASSLPKGDKQRRAILAGLKVSRDLTPEGRAAWEEGYKSWWREFVGEALSQLNLKGRIKEVGDNTYGMNAWWRVKGEPKNKGIPFWLSIKYDYLGSDNDRFTETFNPNKFGVKLGLSTLGDPTFDPSTPGLLNPGPMVYLDMSGSPKQVVNQMVAAISKHLPPQAGLLSGQKWEKMVDPREPTAQFKKDFKAAAVTLYKQFQSKLPRTLTIPPGAKVIGGRSGQSDGWQFKVREEGDGPFPIGTGNLLKMKSPTIGFKFHVLRSDLNPSKPGAKNDFSVDNFKQFKKIWESVIRSNRALVEQMGIEAFMATDHGFYIRYSPSA